MGGHAATAFNRQLITSPRAIILIAWLNIFLLTTEYTIGSFYIIYNHTNRRTKWIILSSLFIDLVCVVILCSEVIDVVTLQRKEEWVYSWHTTVIMILSHCTALLGQGTFFLKYLQSSQSRRIVVPAASFLSLRMISTIVSNSCSLVGISLSPSHVVGNVAALVASILLAFTDLWIVFLLLWKGRTKLIGDGGWQRKVEVATLWVFSHGIVNALTSTLRLFLYFFDFLGYRSISHIMGRAYTLSLIVTLIANKEGKQRTNNSVVAGPTSSRHIRTHVTGTIQLSTISADVPSREGIGGESNVDLADSQKGVSVDFSDLTRSGTKS